MKKPTLVLGGGIAGIQASLDLAESGVPVFLVEESPSIGGRMAQLDKTFPTNDCSACILAPKVTACYNHPLVRTFTWSKMKDIQGDSGNFRVTVERKPRFIDENRCTGCSECSTVCPVEVKSEFDMGVGTRKAIYKPFAQAVPNKVVIDKKGTSPCKYNCPAHLDAHGYVALIGVERYQEALDVVRRTTPFAGVLGRICLHNCENNCSRSAMDEPISIAALKRFIADREIADDRKPEINTKPIRAERIAVIGAGPAGLNCAYSLAKEGFRVTIFEALPVGGGMLKVGIPDYRLDKTILQYEIDIITSMGVEIRYDSPLGENLTLRDLKEEGFVSVFLGIGAHKDMKLGISGEDLPQVISSVKFLRELNLGQDTALSSGDKVLVVGGGNVAMDAARSARRIGCDVTVVYRRTEEEMPANLWEVEHAVAEGVKFEFLISPVEVVVEKGKAAGLGCLRNKLGEPDSSGRRAPEPIEGSGFILEFDYVITAIGQVSETEALSAAGFSGFDRRGRFGSDDMSTSVPGLFAGGDCRIGPASAIEAVADGNKAAKAIINYIDGTSFPIEPVMIKQTDIADVDMEHLMPARRAVMPLLEMERRISSFDEVELGFDEKTALNEARRCADCSICSDCRLCESVCKADAIDHQAKGDTLELEVASVIIATGFNPSSEIPDGYGYRKFPDVVTAMEYERILSASGPYEGHVARPSDRKSPERIAFLQCVGSRDVMCNAEYCSSVCCMYAVKEAMITKEHLPTVKEIDIYYMDIRAHGKDFDRYIDSAKTKYGINFIPARVSDVTSDGKDGLRVSFAGQNGSRTFADYDLVVLSVGLSPDSKNAEFAAKIGLKTDRYGFVWTDEKNPPLTSIPGIFSCGVSAGPKDIPETVMEASAAAAGAIVISMISCEAGTEEENWFAQEPPVPIRDVSKEPVRMGVFVCHCGVNIGGYVDVHNVVEYAKSLPFVAFATENLYTCSVDAQKTIIDNIKEYNLNRVVVASCTPRTHEPLFQGVLKKSGLNPYLFNMANIRDQCSWVHMDDRAAATAKARDLVSMAVGKGIYAKQLERKKINVTKSALVVGAGMAGMSAALELARMNFKVYIAEKSNQPGGNALRLFTTLAGRPARNMIEETIKQVNNNPLIELITGSRITEVQGFVGNFKTSLETSDGSRNIEYGAVVIAVGAQEEMPDEYGFNSFNSVITHSVMEKALAGDDCDLQEKIAGAESVVMIQCAGSRTSAHPYCSRICCNQAVRNATALLENNPDCNVSILYRDMRTYGMSERLYRKARQMGAVFIRYDEEQKPVVTEKNGRLLVKVNSPAVNIPLTIQADIVSLASAIVPDLNGNNRLAQFFKIPLNQDGFFMEAHAKLRPVDFATEGVYLAGLAHSPRDLKEAIIQGKAAAARAASVISKDNLETEGTIARVDISQCTACGACEQVCAYGAIAVTDVTVRGKTLRKAQVNEVLCKGCGTCSANCRCGAIDVNGFTDKQIIGELEALLRK